MERKYKSIQISYTASGNLLFFLYKQESYPFFDYICTLEKLSSVKVCFV